MTPIPPTDKPRLGSLNRVHPPGRRPHPDVRYTCAVDPVHGAVEPLTPNPLRHSDSRVSGEPDQARPARATVRRASRHAIRAVLTRGDVMSSPRRLARNWSISQAGASACSTACVLLSSSPVASVWRPRAIEVSPRSAITGSSHSHGRRAAQVQYPASSARAVSRTSSSLIAGSTSRGERPKTA